MIKLKEFTISNNEIHLIMEVMFNKSVIDYFPSNYDIKNIQTEEGNRYKYIFKLQPTTCFLLTHFLEKYSNHFFASEEVVAKIKKTANMATQPRVYMYDDTRLGIEAPPLKYYQDVMKQIGSSEKMYMEHTVPIARAHDVIRVLQTEDKFLPGFKIEDEVMIKLYRNIEGFDGTFASLASADIADIDAVRRAWKVDLENFKKVGFNSILDFLFYAPTKYIDRTGSSDLKNLLHKEEFSVVGVIKAKKTLHYKHIQFEIEAQGELLQVTYWNQLWISDKFSIGEEILLTAKYDKKGYKFHQVAPISMESLLETKSLPIVPMYKQYPSKGITTKVILRAMEEIHSRMEKLGDSLAHYIKNNYTNMNIVDAIKELHFPSELNSYHEALKTLSYYELVYLQLLIKDRNSQISDERGTSKNAKTGKLAKYVLDSLPFELTESQNVAIKQIYANLKTPSSKRMLLVGDVGSGKTITAQMGILQTVESGFQVAMMGPTEILAKQLYETMKKVLELIPMGERPQLAYLASSVKAAEKKLIYEGISSGAIDIVIGTHSILSEKVPYRNLGLVIIDEDQKIGTVQREALLSREYSGGFPDLLMQTATPIPQATARIMYGDIDFITIKDKPKGRLPIDTKFLNENPMEIVKDKNHPMWEHFREEIKKGHQCYVVVPMVHENKKIDAASVTEVYKSLQKVFPDVEIEFTHGQIKKDEQEERFQRFKNNQAKIIVASAVIEVGVDVPNSTIIAILSADRIGASSLHQMRGRVGRNSNQSYCYLVSATEIGTSKARLQALVDNADGFEIAKIDMRLRGEGNIFNRNQSGSSGLRFANLVNHEGLIDVAQEEAERVYKSEYKERAVKDAQFIKIKED